MELMLANSETLRANLHNIQAASKFVALDPRTALHLREATEAEKAAFLAQPEHPSFRKAIRVGDVLVDEYMGPGLWFGGAGF